GIPLLTNGKLHVAHGHSQLADANNGCTWYVHGFFDAIRW
ncbi:na+ symporter family protein, partial [Vibrio parahaemolyticus AQ3810]